MSDRIEFVDLRATHAEMADELDATLKEVWTSGQFIGGSYVAAFEEEFAAFVGAKEAIGVANGTDALQLIFTAAGLPQGSRAAMPASTFVATAEAAVAAGLEPAFVDVDPSTGLFDLDHLAEVMDGTVSVVVPVHLYGRLAPMEPILELAAAHGAVVVEDAAQAHAARRDGRHAGAFGLAGSFSFYPGKNLGAVGDAGAVVTDDDALADRIRTLANHGRLGDEHPVVGVNSRLDGLQAAVLSAKLRRLEDWTDRRRAVAQRYRSRIDAALLDFEGMPDPGSESHHLFPVLLDDRDGVADALRQDGIMTGVHYRQAVPSTGAFSTAGAFPAAESRARRQLSLPMHPHLSEEDVDRVVDRLHAVLG